MREWGRGGMGAWAREYGLVLYRDAEAVRRYGAEGGAGGVHDTVGGARCFQPLLVGKCYSPTTLIKIPRIAVTVERPTIIHRRRRFSASWTRRFSRSSDNSSCFVRRSSIDSIRSFIRSER